MINYMDRQTLANAAVRIIKQFALSKEQYGNLEMGFGYAFAVGSIVFGFIADKLSVRWVYPAVLLLWSVTGFITGFVTSYDQLFLCRILLGFFEAGHWPCAIKTTQRMLDPKDRSMGNGLLQSGASIGAILTPLIMRVLLTDQLDSWRLAFQIIGAVGILWVPFWLWLVRETDLTSVVAPEGRGTWRDLLTRRMLVVLLVVTCINACWQILRAWLPQFLIEGRHYTERNALDFNAAFFVASDVGCLGAGALALWLAKKGMHVHRSRMLVFFVCALICATSLFIPILPKGWMLLTVLLLIAAGSLGVFPIYHAFTQDISAYHQGKVTGLAGVAAWFLPSLAQKYFGRIVDRTDSYDAGLAIAGCMPLIAFAVLALFWNKREVLSHPEQAEHTK